MMLTRLALLLMMTSSIACMQFEPVVASSEMRPSRTECIAGFHMDWSKVQTDNEIIIRSMLRSALVYKLGEKNPLAAIVRSDDSETLYMQFWFDCDRRDALSSEIIEMWRSKSIDIPKLERIEEGIVPSPTTIDVRGPAWRD